MVLSVAQQLYSDLEVPQKVSYIYAHALDLAAKIRMSEIGGVAYCSQTSV